MRVGVPKEIKVEEYRVGLTPASVREYVARGHEVVVERGAGLRNFVCLGVHRFVLHSPLKEQYKLLKYQDYLFLVAPMMD